MQCPKCHFQNPEDTVYCGKCATPLLSAKEVPFSQTETFQTPVKELTTGSTFAGRYQVIEELGRGGMGKLYKVFDTKIKEKVALKLIRPEIASDRETIERFGNELRLARKIGHRNVCRMFDLGESEGAHFITMEYVHGEDLKSMIRMSGSLSIGMVLSVGKQVCDGLAEAHSLGVVHRDLKPQNIMIDKGGNAKIMDFGIARSVREKGITGAGVMIGTPEYMSPEQTEAKDVDQRSDIYSLGVILYEMATSRVPFEGDTALSIAMKHKGETPRNPKQFNSNIPNDLSSVILKCLEKDRAKRYQNAAEVGAELEKIEKGIPTTERVVPERKPLTSREITVKFKLKKLFIPAVAVVALVVIALIVWKAVFKKPATLLPGEKRSIAIISFKNQTGDKAYDNLSGVIQNLLITNLEQSGYFYVATWERLRDLLKQMGRGDVEFISPELGFELCKMDGVGAIVIGSFAKAGNIFVTNAQVLDVGTKNLLGTASSKGEGPGSILNKQVDELSRQIAKGIGLSERKIEFAKMKIRDVTTSSTEAYNYYLKAKEEFTNFDFDEARKYLDKAVEFDPTFASAYFGLCKIYNLLGDDKRGSEAIVKAWNFSKKATEKERLRIESFYAQLIEKNDEKNFGILKEAAEKYPKDKEVHLSLSYAYEDRRALKQAVEEVKKALSLDPDYPSALNWGSYICALLKDYDKAIGYLKRYASVLPGNPNPFDSLAEVYFKMGRLDQAIENYKNALEVKPDFSMSMQGLAYIYALKEDYSESSKWFDKFIDAAPSPGIKLLGYIQKAFYSAWLGSLEKSSGYIQRAEDLAEAIGNKYWIAEMSAIKSWIYYDRHELELSRKCREAWFTGVLQEYPQFKTGYEAGLDFGLGFIELEEGKLDSAENRLKKLESLLPKLRASKEEMEFYSDLLRSELSLAEGSPGKAIAIFGKAAPLPPLPFYPLE
jgi:serine/threonine protein kinase/tetratricopeptide (TPR) repeat protein